MGRIGNNLPWVPPLTGPEMIGPEVGGKRPAAGASVAEYDSF